MRKLISVLLLVVLAFNWLGYDLVVALMNQSIHRSAEAKIENGNFDRDELIEIKVDLELPYATDWASFEKINGTVSYQGMVYNFVERKYENGHMTYRCLPNQRGTELQNARDYFYSLAYDMEKQDKKESAPKQQSSKKLNIEITLLDLHAQANDFAQQTTLYNTHLIRSRMDGFGFIPAEPPEA